MRIVGASSRVSSLARQFASATPNSAASEAPGSALIAVEAPRQSEPPLQSMLHPSAPFVAHLLATRMHAPQTRARRRAEPEEAIAVYRSMTKPVPCKRAFGTRA